MAIWFHGQGGDADTRMGEEWLSALLDEGWYVASGDLGGNTWGNADGVQASRELVAWAERESGFEVGLFVAGSMGGLASLALVAESDVPCWYGTMPVTDMSTVSNVPDADAQIAEAWPGSVPVSPMDYVDSLPASTRFHVLASEGDTWVPAAVNGFALADSLEARGVDVSRAFAVGEHGDVSHFDADDLTLFAESCL